MVFDNLREKLLVGGIAPRHVRRYLAELNEHLDDLTREQHEAGYDGDDARLRAHARLGSDDELASAMLAQKEFHSAASRAPWAFFTVLPPVAAVAIGMLLIGNLLLIGKYFGYFGVSASSLPPQWFQILAHSLVALSNLMTMPLAAVLFVTIAQRQRLKAIWPLLATLVLLALFFHNDVLFALHGKGHLMLGAGPIFTRHGWMMLTENWQWAMVQYALTILPVLWLYRRRMAIAA